MKKIIILIGLLLLFCSCTTTPVHHVYTQNLSDSVCTQNNTDVVCVDDFGQIVFQNATLDKDKKGMLWG